MANFFSDLLTKGARTILPKSLEYKFGITEKPMEFRIGEGLTPEQTQRAKETIAQPRGIPEEGNFFADVVRAFPRAGARVGVEIGKKIVGAKTAEVQPKTGFERLVFGDEPIKDIPTYGKETLKGFGVGEEKAGKYGMLAGLGLTALDIYPGGFGKKQIVEKIAKETSEVAIKNLIVKNIKNIAKDSVDDLAKNLVKITDPKEVESILGKALSYRKSGYDERAFKELNEIAKIKKSTPTLQPLAQEAQDTVTLYRAAPKFPSDKFDKGTYFADTADKARYYSESHYKGEPQDIKVQQFTLPKDAVFKEPSTGNYVLKGEAPVKISTPENHLLSEAQKYKSAEEFVKAKGGNINDALKGLENDATFQKWFDGSKIQTSGRNSKLEQAKVPDVLYHRSDANFTEFKKMVDTPEYRDTGEAGIYFSNKPGDTYYGKNEYATVLKIKNPYKTSGDFSSLSEKKMNELISQGYDGIVTPSETIIFDPSQAKIIAKNGKQIVSKSQLTDIWNTANKGSKIDPLIAEAKKYKSAEEFVKAFEYHGGAKNLEGGKLSLKFDKSGGIFTTPNETTAKTWQALRNGELYQVYIGDKKLIDLTEPKTVEKIKGLIGTKYTVDGEVSTFTKNDYEFLFPGGKADWATFSNYIPMFEKMGYEGSRIAEGFNINTSLWKDIKPLNKVFTKSQLTDIYNQAVKGVGEVAPKPIPKDLQPLAQEAQKYKSAEEFVKSQKPVYHGTPAKFTKFDTNMSEGGATWFTADKGEILSGKAGAVQGAGQKLNIMDRYVKPDLKLATREMEDKYMTDQLIQQGYRGVKYPAETAKGYESAEWTKLWFPNEDTITKSQLTDIYNQAVKRGEKIKTISTPEEVKSIKAVQELAQGQPSGLKIPQALPEQKLDVAKIVSYSDDSTKLNTSQTINTSKLNVSDDAKKLIENEIESIKPRIEEKIGKKLTNKEAQELADESSKILERAVGRPQTLEWESAMLKLRQRLADSAQSNQVTKEFVDDLVAVKSLGTDLGRKLQSLSIGADPKSITSKQALLSEILKVTDDSDAIVKAAQGVDFNDFKQASEFYRQFVKPSLSEWVDLLRYNSMLSSPLTHMVNIFSNLANSTLRAPITKLVSGGVDLLSSAATGKARTQFAGEAGAYVSGYIKNFQEAFKRFSEVWKGTRSFTHLDLRRQIPLATKGVGAKVEKVLSVPMRLLEGADQFFMALVGGGEKATLTFRQAKGVAVKGIEEQSEQMAKYGLYRQELFKEGQGTLLDAIDVMTSKILSLRNNKNPIISTIAKFTVPFVSTPMNLFKQGIEYSPIGFATALKSTNKVEQLSKALIGTGVAITAGTLISSNRMTWGEPRTANERNAFREAGMQPYSVKIGNRWFSYQKLPPFLSFPLSMVAMVDDSLKEKKLTETQGEFVLSSFAKYAEFLADQSYFKSIGDFFNAVSGDEFAISQLIGNYPQQLVPFRAFGGWMSRMTDGLQRQIDNKAGFIDKQVQLLVMNVPFVSQSIQARKGATGEPIKARDRFLGAVSPIKTISQTPEEEAGYRKIEELKQLNRRENEKAQLLKEEAITLDAEFQELSPEEANARFKQTKKENPELAEKLKDIISERKLGLTYTEKLMKQLGVENGERANYIDEQIMKLGTSEERNSYYKELRQKKIITDEVAKQIKKLKNK